MSVDKCVPEVRFKGFSGEWQEKELGEIGFFKNGMNFDKAAMGHGHPFVNLQDVFGKNEVSNKNLGLAFSTENQRKDYSLNEGDVLFIRSSVKPEGVGETAVIPKTLENTTYSGFIIRFRPRVEMDVNFNRFVYSTANCRKQILASSTSSANSNINQESLQRIQLSLPCKPEQTQIGNYFQKLDNLINQHQQKHDKLSNIKKAMLEKMFPKQGETVPEIRFKGFGGEWVEKELGAVAEIKTGPFGSTLHAKAYVEDGYPIITTEHFKSGELPVDKKGIPQVSDDDYLRLKAYLLKVGDIVFSRVGSVDINAHITNKQEGWLFSGRVLRVRSDSSIDSKYLHHELSTSRVRKSVVSRAVGQTMPSINTEILKITTIHFPVGTPEQTKIGNYFQKLDTLINQHQQQITKLNNIKQACLSKMFV